MLMKKGRGGRTVDGDRLPKCVLVCKQDGEVYGKVPERRWCDEALSDMKTADINV